jgi:hypothetical protein
MRRIAVLAAISVVMAFASGRSAAKEIDKAESRVEISDDRETTRIINRTFEITEGSPPLLLRREIEHEVRSGFDGPGKVHIDAWRLPRAPKDKPVYTISDKGDDIRWSLFPGLLTIRTAACCDSSGSTTVYNGATGSMLLYANGAFEYEPGYLGAVVHGKSVLLIGVHDEFGGRSPRAFPEFRGGHKLVLVTAADPSTCRNQLVFDLPKPSGTAIYMAAVKWEPMKVGSVTGLNVELRGKEPFAGVLRLELDDGRSVTIPVHESGLDSSHVKMPAGGTVSELSPCVL